MYPAHLFSFFPPFPLEERVFVLMSFAPAFTPRWDNVIKPGIEATNLQASRVDASNISDSILTDILKGVSQSRLVVADLTTLNGIRNGNVMYEVGLAQATRQPEEVILFRSDDDPLLFDIANVRVNSYDPDGTPEPAKQLITRTIYDALREIDQRKSMAVQKAVSVLDETSFLLLVLASNAPVRYPDLDTMQEALWLSQVLAIQRLLELGLLKTDYPETLPASEAPLRELITYSITPHGQAVERDLREKFGRASTGGTGTGPADRS